MAFTTIVFENSHTGAMKSAPVGFSWTTFFFGFFPALVRGDWKWGVIQLLLALVTFGFSCFVFAFIYNKLYIKDLISDGFKARSSANGDLDFTQTKLNLVLPRVEA